MPTRKKIPTDLITQSDAADLKGVDLHVVNNWVRRKRLRSYEMFGKTLVSRAEVVAYQMRGPGRPKPTSSAA